MLAQQHSAALRQEATRLTFSLEITATMSSSTKRKSDAGTASSSKKARTSAVNPHASAIALVTSILDTKNFTLPDDDDTITDIIVQLAQYARELEGNVAAAASDAGPGSSATAVKSPAEMEKAVEKLRKAAVAGIKKQMSVSLCTDNTVRNC